jgi:Tfp pilus assembly PilM family ATPase
MISFDFKNRIIRPIGLDIGHDSIKMLQLEINGEKMSVRAAEEARIEIDTNADACQGWFSWARYYLVPSQR